jgi:hypothetical protein
MDSLFPLLCSPPSSSSSFFLLGWHPMYVRTWGVPASGCTWMRTAPKQLGCHFYYTVKSFPKSHPEKKRLDSFHSGRRRPVSPLLWSFIFFSRVHTMIMHIKLWQQNCNVYIPRNFTPWRDSNPGSSVTHVGRRDDRYTTPPGHYEVLLPRVIGCYPGMKFRTRVWNFFVHIFELSQPYIARTRRNLLQDSKMQMIQL